MIRCASLADLGTELGHLPGISMSRNASELKEVNASSLSVTGLLDLMGEREGAPQAKPPFAGLRPAGEESGS